MDDTRGALVMATFVELADTLANDYEVGEFLTYLLERCAIILSADTAGMLLESPEGNLRLAAATSPEMEAIEALEIELGQGPCMEAYLAGEQVIVDDLEDQQDNWPDVTPRILDIGMRSAFAFPLRLRQDRIGALNLYRREPGGFSDEDIRLGQAFADIAAIGILQQRKVTQAEERQEQLQHALDSRIIIEQAKGMLAQRHGVDPGQAFEAIRRYSRENNRKLRDVARGIVEGVTADIPIPL